MKHRMYHSNNLRQALPEYAQRLGCSVEELESAYDWMLQNDVCFERQIKDDMLCSISYVNIEPRIEHPLARRFYAMLGKELQCALVPLYGLNWPTLRDRMLRTWEQIYNIFICKIPHSAFVLAASGRREDRQGLECLAQYGSAGDGQPGHR